MRKPALLTVLAAAAVLSSACGAGAAITGGLPAAQARNADSSTVAATTPLPTETLAPVVLRVDGEQVTILTACQQNGVFAQIEDESGRTFGIDGLGSPADSGSEQPAVTMTDADGNTTTGDATVAPDEQGRLELRSSLSQQGSGPTAVSIAIDVTRLRLCGE